MSAEGDKPTALQCVARLVELGLNGSVILHTAESQEGVEGFVVTDVILSADSDPYSVVAED